MLFRSGHIIAEAMDKVGKDGTITVEEAKGIETTLDVVEGLSLIHIYLGGMPAGGEIRKTGM